MSRPKANPLAQPGQELARMLNHFGRFRRIDQVFYDLVEMSALALSNKVDPAQYDKREARYMQIVGTYEKPEVHTLCEMFAYLVAEMDRTREDVFGPLITKLELNRNTRMGQYFSPWSISSMMAKMMLGSKADIERQLAPHGFVTAMEPASGAGGMILAIARALEDEGFNYQDCLHVTAVDIDPHCAHMTYVQAALMGIPAIIYQGHSLRNTIAQHWYTPMHVLGSWGQKLKQLSEAQKHGKQLPEKPAILPRPPAETTIEDLAKATSTELAAIAEATALMTDLPSWHLRIGPGTSPPFIGAD